LNAKFSKKENYFYPFGAKIAESSARLHLEFTHNSYPHAVDIFK
jgi:hypothetical protein